MTLSDGQRRTRTLVCDGCYRHCRYADFRALEGGKRAFAETVRALTVSSDAPEKWRYKRRNTVLGMMYAEKQAAWSAMMGVCPEWGVWLKVGDRVKWETKEGGKMEGTVVAEVPAGARGEKVARSLGGGLHMRMRRDSPPRQWVSYLVAVRMPGRRQRSIMWPNQRYLELLVQP